MNADDTDDSIYTIAFDGDRFLMIWNPKRNGWEMPGGHIKKGETRIDGAMREFREESGYSVEIVAVRDLGHCRVCAARLGKDLEIEHEMEVRLFDRLPDRLAFDRAEYEDTVPWAAKLLSEKD